jgi:protein-tyrosine phosphatase
MIDLHTHVLSGLDDGAKALEESIQMCWISYKDGVRTLVATPHILPGIYENSRSTILAKLRELNIAITECGVQIADSGVKNLDHEISYPLDVEFRILNSEFRILPGADVHFSSDILQRYERGEIVTVNDQGRYLMVEFAFQGIPYQAEEVLFELLTKGIIPIISHPERNIEIGQNPKRYYEMIRMGCLGQVTAMSLTGEFGREVKEVVKRLMKKRLVHFIASDAHSINGRRPILSDALRVAEKMVGKEEAWKMVNDYPQAVLEGRRPNVPEPIAP